MEKQRRVLVYGNSLSMAGIAASLRAASLLEVLSLDPGSADAPQSLDENDLAAVVFDLSDSPMGLDVTLLRDRPSLLLIGVDPSRDEILVLSSHTAQALSMADLVSVIHQQECPSSSFHREKHEMNRQR